MKLVNVLKGALVAVVALSAVGCVTSAGMGAKQTQLVGQFDKEA